MKEVYLTAEQSREIDRVAMEVYGIAGIQLMRTAGHNCAQQILRLDGIEQCRIVVLAGPGNNGGDGYVIASELLGRGCDVSVLSLVPEDRIDGDAAIARDEARQSGVEIQTRTQPDELERRLEQVLQTSDAPIVVVDCMLGTGSSGKPREPIATAIRTVNRYRTKVSDRERFEIHCVAIDVPSGLNVDTGEASDPTLIADQTLTFVAAKIGFCADGAERFTGVVHVVAIGIPDELMRRHAPD